MAEENSQSIKEARDVVLVGEIFQKAKILLTNFGKDSPFKETPGQKIVNLDVEDKRDLRGHTRVNILGDLQDEEIKIMFNSNYFKGSYLLTEVKLTKDRVIAFKQSRSEEVGGSTRIYPHHSILRPKYSQAKPNLGEIKKFLSEGKIKQDREPEKNKKPFWRIIFRK